MQMHLIFLLMSFLPFAASAQSNLPACWSFLAMSLWNDCNGTFTYANGTKYVGEYKNGKPNGRGNFTSGNGDKYVGEFRDGFRNGQGTFTFANGDKYVGEFTNGTFNGHGNYIFANGNKYIGDFKINKRDGVGNLLLNNGSRYFGHFKADTFNGQGTLIHESGEKYDGEFINGKFAKGEVIRNYSNGEKYIGNYFNQSKHGFGELLNADGSVSRKGLWVFDEFIEPLTTYDTKGFSNSELQKLIYDSLESRISSALKNNFPVCQLSIGISLWNNCIGQYLFSDGKYTGEFINGKGTGLGTYTFINGSKYVGEFKEFQAHNLGILYGSYGQIERSGIWRANIRVDILPLDSFTFPLTGLPLGVFDSVAAAEAEAERLEKARIAEAERLEKARIEAEGDGSVADLECQAKKFKPSTQPYQRCLVVFAARKAQEAAAEEKRENLRAEQERKRIAAENAIEERKQRADLVRVDAEARRNTQATSGENSLLGFESAKLKCIELGFKPKTEGYGKCVLQLSK